MDSSLCPLCHCPEHNSFYQKKEKSYFQCSNCHLIYLSPENRLNLKEEKSEYDKHENSPQDRGYVKFLSRLLEPMLKKIPKQSQGLDFGCGPGPTLSLLFEDHDHRMEIYDPIYFPNNEVFQKKYDFISASEVIEHVFRPDEFFSTLLALLNPRGILGLMTKLSTGQQDFSKWHYKDDPTHVCFYCGNTFEWIAKKYQLQYEIIGADIIILKT